MEKNCFPKFCSRILQAVLEKYHECVNYKKRIRWFCLL